MKRNIGFGQSSGMALTTAICVALLGSLLGPSTPSLANEDEDKTIEHIGDFTQVLLPSAAFISTFFVGDGQGNKWDRQGTKQFTYSFGCSWLTARLLKLAVDKARPNGDNPQSFPSGHTNAAFSGAAFISTRYNGIWSWVAYGTAVFTGYSRVHSSWHFADDVLAGASIALLYNWVFVTPHSSRLMIVPTIDENGTGVAVSVGQGGSDDQVRRSPLPEKPFSWRFDFAFGPAFLRQNLVAAPAETGTKFDMADFEKRNDPLTTAAASFERIICERHRLALGWWPFETRDVGTLSQPVDFGGVTYPAETEINSAWRMHDIRLRYRYALTPRSKWDIQIGGGLLLQDTYISLQTVDESLDSSIEDVALVPYAHYSIGYLFGEHWALSSGGALSKLSNDWLVDTGIYVDYLLNRHWGLRVGYQFYDREISTDELFNRVSYNIPHVSVNYSW